ncbi:MAG: hypothetical protein KF686_03450 [Ramlibacter sp.]|nr:hypothetical protein [Ramlibacter sp.]
MIREPVDLAPFPDADAALRFAYRHRQGDYPSNMLGLRRPAPAGEGPVLPSGQEACALAGWVQQLVEGCDACVGLVEPYRSIVVARYCVRPRENLSAKIKVLAWLQEHAPQVRAQMLDLLLQRYFGGTVQCADGIRRPIRQHQIADACGVTQPAVSQAWSRIQPWLAEHERRAMEMLYRSLQGRGLVS